MPDVGDQVDPDVRPDVRPDPDAIADWDAWQQALAALRRASGLSLRQIAARSDNLPVSTADGYLTAKHLPAAGNTQGFSAVLRTLGEGERVAAWLKAADRVRRRPGPRAQDDPLPYRGLDRHDLQDARWFFGRDEVLADLLNRATDAPSQLLVLVGASGSGKSSLLRAGLAARLAGQGYSVSVHTPAAAGEQLVALLRQAQDEARQQHDGRVLLGVDQAEELWSAEFSAVQRRQVLTALTELAAEPNVVVGLTLRADFYPQALAEPVLADQLRVGQVLVPPMSIDQLRQVITAPAQEAGLTVEPGLVEVLEADLRLLTQGEGAATDHGVLPLLSYAMLRTWQASERNRLTVQAYRSTGGVAKAVAEAGEQVLTELGAGATEAVRRILLRLVRVHEHGPDTRRQVPLQDLSGQSGDPLTRQIVEHLVAARLLTVEQDHVSVSHEALITAWPRLRGWLDDDRAGLLALARLREWADDWQRGEQDPDLLLSPGQVERYRPLFGDARWAALLSSNEAAYLDASFAAQLRRTRQERQQLRRVQLLSAALAVALVAVVGLAGYLQWTARRTVVERDQALSRQLAEAANRLRSTDPTVAGRLALLAHQESDTVEARSALLDATQGTLPERLPGLGGLPAVSASADGALTLSADDRGEVRLWRRSGTSTTLVGERSVQPQPLYAAALAPGGEWAAVAGIGGVLRQVDLTGAQAPASGATHPIPDGWTVLALAAAPDGSALAAAVTSPDAEQGRLLLFPVRAGRLGAARTLLSVKSGLQAVTFAPDGSELLVGGVAGRIWRFAVDSGDGQDSADPAGSAKPPAQRAPLRAGTATITSLTVSPDGARVAAASMDQSVYLWQDLRSQPAKADQQPLDPSSTLSDAQSRVNAVAFAAGGQVLAAGGSDSKVRLYEASSATLMTTVGHPGPVTALAATPDALLTGSADGRVRRLAMPPTTGVLPAGQMYGLGMLPGQGLVAVGSEQARLFEGGQRYRLPALTPTFTAPGAGAFASTLAVSPRGDLFVIGGRDGTSWLYSSGVRPGAAPQAPVTLPHQQSTLVQAATFIAGGTGVVTSDDAGTLQVTDLREPQRPRAADPVRTEGTVYALATSPDGRLMATGTGTAGQVQLWDSSDPSTVRLLATAPPAGSPTLQVYGLAFSPDGSTLAVASADSTLRLLDLRAGPEDARWQPPLASSATDYLPSVRFSPDGTRLASVGNDGTVRIYSVAAQEPGSAPRAEPYVQLAAMAPNGLYSVAFSETGDRLFAAGATPVVAAWQLEPSLAAARVCATGAAIERAEWQRYLPSIPYRDPCLARG